jgi:hypothetical protein
MDSAALSRYRFKQRIEPINGRETPTTSLPTSAAAAASAADAGPCTQRQ